MRQTEHKIYRIMVMSGDRHACKWFDATQGGGGGPSYERFSTGFLLLSLINGGSGWPFGARLLRATGGRVRPSTFKATVPIPALLPGAEVFIITSADFLGAWG